MKRIALGIATITAISLSPIAALAQSVPSPHASLQGNAHYQCSKALLRNNQSVTPVDASAFWYSEMGGNVVVAFQTKPATPRPWQRIFATNCLSGSTDLVWWAPSR